MKEYCKLHLNKKDKDENETDRIITKPEHFTKKTHSPNRLHELDNYSGSITGEFGASLTDLQRLDTVT